jgi:hypothetical protein
MTGFDDARISLFASREVRAYDVPRWKCTAHVGDGNAVDICMRRDTLAVATAFRTRPDFDAEPSRPAPSHEHMLVLDFAAAARKSKAEISVFTPELDPLWY